MGHFCVIFAVLEIVVGHRTFLIRIDICLNNFGFDWTKCPIHSLRKKQSLNQFLQEPLLISLLLTLHGQCTNYV